MARDSRSASCSLLDRAYRWLGSGKRRSISESLSEVYIAEQHPDGEKLEVGENLKNDIIISLGVLRSCYKSKTTFHRRSRKFRLTSASISVTARLLRQIAALPSLVPLTGHFLTHRLRSRYQRTRTFRLLISMTARLLQHIAALST